MQTVEYNRMSFNFCICIAAVGDRHIDRALNLIKEIKKENNFYFIILTDQQDKFTNLNNVETIKYNKTNFSYHDKRIVIKEGLKKFDYIVLMDADHAVRSNNTLKTIKNFNLPDGIYVQLLWKHPAVCSFQNFIQGRNNRVPYGLEYKEYCLSLGLFLQETELIQESFLVMKNSEKVNTFLDIWDKLALFCEEKDSIRNQKILGYGEGYSIALAATNAQLKVYEHNSTVDKFITNFKHLAWEK